MTKRCSSGWFLIAVIALSGPAWSSAQEPDKERVLALSRTIDALIAAKQRAAGVVPAPRADDSTYFRRLNLDLVGRIPTLTDHRDFLDNPDDRPAVQSTKRIGIDYAREWKDAPLRFVDANR